MPVLFGPEARKLAGSRWGQARMFRTQKVRPGRHIPGRESMNLR